MRLNCLFFRNLYHQLWNCKKQKCSGYIYIYACTRARPHTHTPRACARVHAHAHAHSLSLSLFKCPYQFIPLLNLGCHIQFTALWLVYLHLFTPCFYGNIIFYLCLFDLHPLFQEHDWGLKQGFGVCVCVCVCVYRFKSEDKNITLYEVIGMKTNQRDKIFNKLRNQCFNHNYCRSPVFWNMCYGRWVPAFQINVLLPSSEYKGAMLVNGRLY